MYEIDPASVFSSIVCPKTKLDGSQVSDRCPLGYLFEIEYHICNCCAIPRRLRILEIIRYR